jgi:hypothetical protein
MPNVNPGPASTATPSATNVLAPASTPNFGNLYQGSDAFRLLAFQQAVNISTTGDNAVMPLINTQRFSFQTAGLGVGAIIAANPGAFVNGVFTPGTAAACVLQLWSGPNATGTSITASTTLTGFTGATAAASILPITSTGTGFYLATNWGVGATSGQGGASSYNIYVHVTTASAATATQFDLYVYGLDLT